MNPTQNSECRRSRKWWVMVSAIAVLFLLAGALFYHYSQRQNPPPVFVGDNASPVRLNQKVGCPPSGPDTLVIFGIGQSNAGNHGPPIAGNAVANPHVFEYWKGNCYLASSPLLGATGAGESLWPILGKSLIASGVAKNVVISVFAVDGASIRRFVSPNELKPYWILSLQSLLAKYTLDYVVWLQGEADYARKTTQVEYTTMFGDFALEMRAQKTAAPILVSRQTYCANVDLWEADNPIAKAQVALASSSKRVLPGPDADQILGSADGLRWDGCHPSLLGFNNWALAWTNNISQQRNAAR